MSISINLVTNRTTGVAPLYINFDASGTVSTNENTSTKAFRNLGFFHDYGDPGSSTWSTGNTFANSKNKDYDGIGAHVYETPGSYTYILKVYDKTEDITASTSVSITVSDQEAQSSMTSTNCVVVSTSSVFTGAPAGATQVTTADISTAFAALTGTRKRILFRRGHTWTDTAPTDITASGRVVIGTWAADGVPGTGAKPIFSANLTNPGDAVIRISTTDLSMTDCEVRQLGDQITLGNGDGAGGDWSQITILRCTVQGSTTGAGFYSNEFAGTGIHSQICVQDCTFTGSYASYFAASSAAIMGTSMDGLAAGVGTFRTQFFTRSIFSHNVIKGSAALFHLLKWGAPKRGFPPDQYDDLDSEFSVCADNEFDDRAGLGGWLFALGTENTIRDERVHDQVFRRNWTRYGANTEVAYKCFGPVNCRFDNNIINMTGGADGNNDVVNAYMLERRNLEPNPVSNEIFNNTLVRGGAAYAGPNALNFVRLLVDADSNVTRNNIAYTPTAPSHAAFVSDAGTNNITSTNSNNTQMTTTNPGPSWVLTSTSSPVNFQITSTSSYADGAGSAQKIMMDYFLRSRIGVTNDLGFHQFVEGSYPWDSSGPAASVGIARGTASMLPRFR